MKSFHPADDAIALCDMVARIAPIFMRCGDAACRSDTRPDGFRFVGGADKEQFAAMLRAGRTVDEVAEATRFHYQTVLLHTREVRKQIGYGKTRRGGVKLYISRLRQPDGTWSADPEARTLRETKRLAIINRHIGGVTTQIWPEAEGREKLKDEFPSELGEGGRP